MSAVLLWFLACTFPLPDCMEGYERNESDTCVESAGTDTGLAALEGAYEGNISISIGADTGSLPIEDVCEGTVAFDLADGILNGEVRCAFTGTVADLIGTEPFEGSMDGTAEEDGNTEGQIVLDLGAFGVLDEPWSGTVSSEQIEGAFAGTMNFEIGSIEIPVQFEGSFTAEP